MNLENKKLLWALIQETGDFLIDKLPDDPRHPKGRNPFAHVALSVKNHFNCSYKDLPDNRFEEVVKLLELIRKEEG